MNAPATSVTLNSQAYDTAEGPLIDWQLLLADKLLASTNPADAAPLPLDPFVFVMCAAGTGHQGEFKPFGPLGPSLHVRWLGLSRRWVFPREAFEALKRAGIVEGEPREVTFVVEDAPLSRQVSALIKAAQGVADVLKVQPRLGRGHQPEGESVVDQCKATSAALHALRPPLPQVVSARRPLEPYDLSDICGSAPDTAAVLVQRGLLSSHEHGTWLAVGAAASHDVYRFEFNDASQKGEWVFQYQETAARALPDIADHCRVDGWRGRREPYIPQQDWPSSTYVQWGSSGVVFRQEGGDYSTAFFEAFPREPELKTFIRGEGVDVQAAEASAFAKLEHYRACPGHEFERRGYTNGAGFCKHCGMFQSGVFPKLPPDS